MIVFAAIIFQQCRTADSRRERLGPHNNIQMTAIKLLVRNHLAVSTNSVNRPRHLHAGLPLSSVRNRLAKA